MIIEVLKNIQYSRFEIMRLKKKIDEIEASLYNAPTFEFKSGRISKTVEETLIKISTINLEYLKKYGDHLNSCLEIEKLIDNLDNIKYKQILLLKYIEGHSYEQIAKIMNYDYDYVRALHKKALQYFLNH